MCVMCGGGTSVLPPHFFVMHIDSEANYTIYEGEV